MDAGPVQWLERETSRSSTQLRFYVGAKRKINEIYKEVSGHITDSHAFLDGISAASQVVSDEQLSKVEAFRNQVRGIQDVLERDRMKVAFFGRTSNGKSTVINAMLRDKVLPSGIGHTTDCFLCVEGCEGQEGYMSRLNSSEKMSITSVSQLAHALAGECDHEDCRQSSILHIFWPKTQCHLLMNDVILIDSPGIDVEQGLDKWINTHCVDADVFVLVLNAESTLMTTEKSFFLKVSEKLSKPNIFILNNRWDASANEPEFMEAVKRQHLEREIKFLVEELKVVTEAQAKDRVFFVSAKEALNSRIPKTLSTQDANQIVEGYQERLCEFENYERKLEECISQTAVSTKFEQHAKQGRQIVDYTQEILSQILEAATKKRAACIEKRQDQNDRLDYLKDQMKILSKKIEERIRDVSKQGKSKVSATETDEIRKLSPLVNSFDKSFVFYKEELRKHMEASLRQNLAAICSAVIKQSVEEAQTWMTELMSPLLPEDSKERVKGLLFHKDFDLGYCVDFQHLFINFKENLGFRFSLSPTAIMNRFLGQNNDAELESVLKDLLHDGRIAEPSSKQTAIILKATGYTIVVILACICIVTGNIQFLLKAGACSYILAYVYEYLKWRFYEEDRVVKEQFIVYASDKLKLRVECNSSNISYQIQRELLATFDLFSEEVENSKQSLEKEIVDLEVETKRLEGLITKAKLMRDKAGGLDNELERFIEEYILH